MNGDQSSPNKPAVAGIERGAGWLTDGFGYFTKAPMAWIGAVLILFIIFIAMGFIPIIGSLAAQILMPVFFAGLLVGCHAQYNGGEFTVNHLFAGFSQNTSKLVLLGVIYTLLMVAIVIIVAMLVLLIPGAVGVIEQIEAGDVEKVRYALTTVSLVLLISLALMLPLWMAYWFAPVLVILEGYSPVDAMKASFTGCLYNIIPFLLYGVVLLVLSIIASIPFMLGWLILTPMLCASVYVAYRDIYKSAES